MKKMKNASVVAIIGLLLAGTLALCTGLGSADSLEDELNAKAQELVDATKAIHDNTEKIADDESLDSDVRAKAEEVHEASHEMWEIAAQVKKDAEDDNLDAILDGLEEYSEILDKWNDPVHEIMFEVPDSHRKYADAAHDGFHDAQRIVDDIEEIVEELE